MTEDSKKQDTLLETTDCLEAIGTLKSNKNFFFVIIFICLFLLQGCFWIMFTEHIDQLASDTSIGNETTAWVNQPNEGLVTLASKTSSTVTVETSSEKIEQAAQTIAAEPNAAKTEPNASWRKYTGDIAHVKIKFDQLAWVIKICDYLLIVSSIMYSLTLLFSLKISLVGRLGGISHITKAFFVSLFMIVLLMPWQVLFRGVIVGAIYTPTELLASWMAYPLDNFVGKTFMFVRYTGLTIIVLLLLVWAQLKSMRWSKNTLKRLGIVG